jgi:hypothetical protein
MRLLPSFPSALALVLLATGSVFSAGEIEVNTNWSVPLGDFESKEGGNARQGFGVGAGGSIFFKQRVAFVAEISLLHNPDNTPALSADGQSGSWMNLPVLAGLRLQSDPGRRFRGYGQLQAGYAMVWHTDVTGGGFTDSMDGRPAGCLGVGAGVVLGRQWHMGLRFFQMGQTNHIVEETSSSRRDRIRTRHRVLEHEIAEFLVGFTFGSKR